MPSLFAVDTQFFGWQGMTITMPSNWTMTSFGGNNEQGYLRIDDEEVPRLELRWEKPKTEVDLDLSVEKFLDVLVRAAKKKKEHFEIVPDLRLVSKSRKRKEQILSFGWAGEKNSPVGQGCGVIWKCGDCGRVVVGHIMGRGAENAETVQRLAGEVLSSMECHGSGGWQTWSVFGLKVEIPEEFLLSRSKLMTGRLEIEWMRKRKPGLLAPWRRDETLAVTRVALADVLLERETLEQWTAYNMAKKGKHWFFTKFKECTVRDHPAIRSEGMLRDVSLRARWAFFDLVLRRRTPRGQMLVWNCESSNKIFVFTHELSQANQHVADDVIDSLECHS